MRFNRGLYTIVLGVGFLCFSADAFADDEKFTVNIPQGDAVSALNSLALQTRKPLLFDFNQVKTINANALSGQYTLQEALDLILKDTGLTGSLSKSEAIKISLKPKSATLSEEEDMKIQGKKSLLGGVSAAILSAMALPANAQTSQQSADEIVVTGIRASVERGVAIKRDSDAIVDAISAEGIGAFPDTNLAEALQRISGVSIDRSGGEGEFVSVRGFGPEFNTVLFNGRQMPTTNGGRDFSFDTIASEMVSRLQVYKTSPVNLQAGGIGSTIDIQTPRPLDKPGFHAGFSADASYESNSEKVSPRIFGSISNTFADDRVGIYLAATYQEREAQIEEARTNGWQLQAVGGNINSGQFAGTAPADGTRVFLPFNFDHWVNNEKRERLGLNAVAQIQAAPNLVFTADVLHSELKVESQADALAQWFGNVSLFDDISVDGNNSTTSLTRVGGFNDFVQRSFNRPDETTSFGFNADWDATETLNISLDYSSASAESDNGGQDVFAVIGRPSASLTYSGTGGGNVPTITGLPTDLGTNFNNNFLHAALRQTAGGDSNNGSFKDDVEEARFDITWSPTDAGPLTEVRAGLLKSDREKDNRQFATPAQIRTLYAGYFQSAPSSLFRTVTNDGFLSSNGGSGLASSYVGFDANELIAYLESPAALAIWDTNPRPAVSSVPLPAGSGLARLNQFGGSYAAQETGGSFNVEEEIFDAYLDFKLEGDMGQAPWTLTAGGRYTKTDVTAVGTQQDLVDLTFTGAASILDATFGPNSVEAVDTNSYEEFLPNVTFKIEPMENVVARAAYTHTLTRPSPLDLAPRINYGILRPTVRTANSGNTRLDPFISKNIDLSLEWYPASDASFSVAYFRKDTDGFIVNGVNNVTIPLATPNSPYTGFELSQPVNGEDAVIDGVEIGANYAFRNLPEPFDGLGVQANATFVSSDKEFDLNQFLTSGNSFGIEGISNTKNIVVYYDKGPFEARVAWNQRDEFLQQLANPTGGLPINVDAYDQFDARIAYDFNDTFTFYAEGVNLTGSVVERFAAYPNQFLGAIDSGPRYSFGVRGQF